MTRFKKPIQYFVHILGSLILIFTELRRLLIPPITFKFAELFTFYVKISQVLALPEVICKIPNDLKTIGAVWSVEKYSIGKKIPVITYCAAVTRSSGGKGGEWRQFGTWSCHPLRTSKVFFKLASAKCLGNQ